MNNLNTEIEQRLNDPLWERRILKAVTQKIESEKKKLWISHAAASIGFAVLLGALSYVSVFSNETSVATNQLTEQPANETELPAAWRSFENFPIEADEEIAVFLTMAY